MRRSRQPLSIPQLLVPITIVTILSVVAVAGLRGAFVDWSFITSGVLGAVGAATVVVLAHLRRLILGEAIAASLLGFVVLGSVATGKVPGPSALRAFFDGLINGWADFLSIAPPVDVVAEFRVIPYAIAWAGVVIGGEIARAVRIPALPVVGPLVATAATLLLTVEQRGVALAQGTALAAGAVVLGLAQQRTGTRGGGRHDVVRSGSPRGWTMAAVAVLAVALLAPLAGPQLPLAGANDRFDLRELQVPPWNPLDAPSPLVEIKGSLREDRSDEVVFTVTGDDQAVRWQIAVLEVFDGVVWAVAHSDAGSSAEFLPVGSQLPPAPPDHTNDEPPDSAYADGADTDDTRQVTHEVTIHALDGPWVPTPGRPTRLEMTDTDIRFNVDTGTAALPNGLHPGMAYRVEAELPPVPGDSILDAARVRGEDRSRELSLVPPQVRNLAADLVEGVPFGWPQVSAVRSAFQGAYYDNGPMAPPGHSYARIAEFLHEPDRIVGYEEQYAAAAGVITRIAALPTRIVVGYLIPHDRYDDGHAEVYADDISAWLELRTDEYGWVPVDVTPDRSREPTDVESGVTTIDVAIPNPPVPPPPPPPLQFPEPDEHEAEEEDEEEEDEEDEEEGSNDEIAAGVLLLAVAGGGPVIGALLFAFVVILLKTRRRRRRRRGQPASRIAGAFAELIDRYHETGLRRPKRATPRETIHTLAHQDPASADSLHRLEAVAAVVDRAAFHPVPPDESEADQAWEDCDAAIRQLYAGRSWWYRFRMRIDPRPLLNRDPVNRKEARRASP